MKYIKKSFNNCLGGGGGEGAVIGYGDGAGSLSVSGRSAILNKCMPRTYCACSRCG